MSPRILGPARRKDAGVSLPGASAQRSSGSLGPASGQTDRRTMGPGLQLGPARPGSPGPGPACGGRLRAEPVARSRGAALQTDKAKGRQTDGGGKRWRRGRRERAPRAPSASEAGARVSPLPLPPPQPGPPLRPPGARAWRCGRGLRQRGPRRRDFRESASSGPRDHPASHPPRSFSGALSPFASPNPPGHVNSILTISSDSGFLLYHHVQPQNPHAPDHSSTAGSPCP